MTSETKKKTPTRSRKKKTKITPKAKAESGSEPPKPADATARVKQVDVVQVVDSAPAAQTRATSAKTASAKKKRTRKKAAGRTSKTKSTDGAHDGDSASTTQEPAQGNQPAVDAPTAVDVDGNVATDRPAEGARETQGTGRPRRRRPGRRSKKTPETARDGDAQKTDAPPRTTDAEPRETSSEKDATTGTAQRQGEQGTERRAPRTTRRPDRKRTTRGRRSSANVEIMDTDDTDVDERELDVGAKRARGPDGKRTMLINVSAGDECRIAVVHQNRLEELFIERASSASHVGNIYKGRIMNVEPSIQAAFIDFGLPKNGFLHISDVQPQYFPDYGGEPEDVGRKIPRRSRPPIQECFRRGQEVIVQVIKEGVGTKGPTLTTYLSIPGRFLVMMPGMSRTGVSRKIEDDDARREMRDALNELKLPPGIGFILRTAGLGRTKRDLQRDLNYLLRLWKTVVARVKKLDAPAELYRESDLVTRTLRDLYSSDFERVVVDDADAARRAREFFQIAMPRSKADLELYSDREPLFHRFGIEEELENINMREVPLRSGGSLVIDSTEALVAIDVNSGRFRSPDDAEEMAYRLNLEAAEEIARQLRLRDLGGLIICDFIDMRLDRHKRTVERALRDALKEHKERARILRMSAFGLIEMTRQRRGPSMKRNTYFECQHCKGTGLVKMPESVVLDVMRIVQLATNRDGIQRIVVTVSSDVAYQILNRKRAVLAQIETETGREIVIRGDETFTSDQVECIGEDSRGHPVPIVTGPQQRKGRR